MRHPVRVLGLALMIACRGRNAPVTPPDLTQSIRGCQAPTPPAPPVVEAHPRAGTLEIQLVSSLDAAWRGQSSVLLYGPVGPHAATRQIARSDAHVTFTGVSPGRYVARVTAISHYSRVDTLTVSTDGARLRVPLDAAPTHACGFDGYDVRVGPPTTRQPNER